MPTDIEIKEEIKAAIIDKTNIEQVIKEIDFFSSKDEIDGKSVLQTLYSQWKSGKKGKTNIHNSWTAFYLGITTCKPSGEFSFSKRRVFARPSPCL